MGKIVAISDLHLGQCGADGMGQFSLLSARAPGNLIEAFAAAVKAFAAGEHVTLVIVGDLLDLSLSYMAEALYDLEHLLRALEIDAIVSVVGNHDHHLWTLHSEEVRLLWGLREGRCPPLSASDPAAMSMYQPTGLEGEFCGLLQPLIDRIYGDRTVPIKVAYPSYAQPAGATMLYFTHGHLFGGLYTTLSNLLADRLTGLPYDQSTAIANQPIIELIYWLLGETGGGLGADGLVEQIYTDLQRGTDSKLRALIVKAVAQELPAGLLPIIPAKWQQAWIDKLLIKKLNAYAANPTTAAAAAQARHADVKATRAQLEAWIHAVSPLKEIATTGQRVCLAYGHTHVWDRYAVPRTHIEAWNLNTWLVEPDRPLPRTGFLGIEADGSAAWHDVTA